MIQDNSVVNDNTPKEEEFDTTGLLLAFLANWKWFLLSVVVCLIAAYFFIATRIPVYQVNASIYLNVENDGKNNPFAMSAADAMVALKNDIDESELEIMKSRNNLTKIVDSLNLAYSYYEKGTFRRIPLYKGNAVIASLDSVSLGALRAPITIEIEANDDKTYNIKAKTSFNGVKEEKEFNAVTLPREIQLSQGTVTVMRSPVIADFEGTQIVTINNPRDIAGAIAEGLTIEFEKNSKSIVRINCSTDDVERGVDIINAILDFYNQDIIADKNRSAIQTEAFILDRLVMISDELKEVENRLQEYRQAHNITDIRAQSALNLNLQSDYELQRTEIAADINIIEEIEQIVSSADTYEALPSVSSNPTITQVIEGYNRKISQLNRTLEGSTPDNPLVASIREELSRDKVRILQNLSTIKRNLHTQYNSIRGLESRSTSQLASTPKIDKGLQEIFREQQVKVNIYTFLLQRREEIALQKTMATNTARLIDDPLADEAPISPRKMVLYAVALIIGLAIPAALIYVRRLVFPVFSDQEELSRLTSTPILGEICTPENDKDRSEIVVGENVATPIAELFRLLRNNIAFTRNGKDSKVILVTSSISGEGKTFIAANLAMTYALTGKKVVVVGMDLRRPMLVRRLGFTNQQGVTTFLSGQTQDIGKLLVQSNESPNLYILPAGPIPPNPNELLMSDNMSRLMTHLRNEFEYVIVDTAPVGMVSDTYLILRHSDLQLYVTRANYTSKNNLKQLHDAVAMGKFSSVYIVLNGVNITSNSYVYRRYGEYGRYGRYGYGSGKSKVYGYGYASKKSTKDAE